MSARTSPTERQKRLGAEVRKMRTASGMSAEYAARLLGVDRGKLSHIESGVRAISPERVRTLACNCACADADYVSALVEMASPTKRGWWERYRGTLPPGLLDIAELEAHARCIRSAHPLHIPGVLQTTDHALAVFRAVLPPLPEGKSHCGSHIAWSGSNFWKPRTRPITPSCYTRPRFACSSVARRLPGPSWSAWRP